MTKMLRLWAFVASLFAIMNIAGDALASTTIASRSGPCAGYSGCADCDDDDCDDDAGDSAPVETRRRHSDVM